jgi:flagellar hook protein FlgE
MILKPGTAGTGKVIAGALEMSNVDLASEFTDMIVAQRGFQANSKTISAADQILQDVISLKR